MMSNKTMTTPRSLALKGEKKVCGCDGIYGTIWQSRDFVCIGTYLKDSQAHYDHMNSRTTSKHKQMDLLVKKCEPFNAFQWVIQEKVHRWTVCHVIIVTNSADRLWTVWVPRWPVPQNDTLAKLKTIELIVVAVESIPVKKLGFLFQKKRLAR